MTPRTWAEKKVERLERELTEANERADRAVKDRAAVLDVKTKEGLSCSEWLMRTAKAEKDVADLKQQVAQLRENVSKIECELSEWKLASAANETGHLFRCARVNGKWSCAMLPPTPRCRGWCVR